MSEIIFGKNSIIEALKSGQKIEKICIYNELREKEKLINLMRNFTQDLVIREKTRNELSEIAGHTKTGGIIAYIPKINFSTMDDILSVSKGKKSNPFLVILDSVQDPRNLGAIMRSAEALDVDGIIIPKNRGAHVTGLVINASAGAFFHLKVTEVVNIPRIIDDLKKKYIWVAGIEEYGKQICFETDFTVPLAVVMGFEGKGLRRLVKEKCDFLIKIPMKGHINSLNVSSAASIIFYEVMKQRTDII